MFAPPPARPISARMLGDNARYATEEARKHRPIVWDRTLALLILAGVAALALVLVLSWALWFYWYPR